MTQHSHLPIVDPEKLRALHAAGAYEELFDLLTQPLHALLYERQTFEFLAELTGGQRMLLCYDYVRMQAGQGGFIQLIQNGYIALLLPVIEGLQEYRIGEELVRVLDDV